MTALTNFIYDYGLLAMFFLILIEYACFPVSSEIVLPLSGAVASMQHINFLLIIPISIIAGLLGTSFCFFIGKIGGSKLLTQLQQRFPKTEKSIQKSYHVFNEYGCFAVCFGRIIPICRTYIAFVAGAVQLSYLTFIIYSAVGITIWNILLIGLGYVLRENWALAGMYYKEYKSIALPILGLLVIYLIYHFSPLKNYCPRLYSLGEKEKKTK